MWILLRKGGAHVYVRYGHAFTNNLMAYDTRVRIEGDEVELALDLNPNLRVRDTGGWPHIDASDLVDDIDRLALVQLSDAHILKGLERFLSRREPIPAQWVLQVELKGTHRFAVSPGADGSTLSLNVIGAPSGSD